MSQITTVKDFTNYYSIYSPDKELTATIETRGIYPSGEEVVYITFGRKLGGKVNRKRIDWSPEFNELAVAVSKWLKENKTGLTAYPVAPKTEVNP